MGHWHHDVKCTTEAGRPPFGHSAIDVEQKEHDHISVKASSTRQLPIVSFEDRLADRRSLLPSEGYIFG